MELVLFFFFFFAAEKSITVDSHCLLVLNLKLTLLNLFRSTKPIHMVFCRRSGTCAEWGEMCDLKYMFPAQVGKGDTPTFLVRLSYCEQVFFSQSIYYCVFKDNCVVLKRLWRKVVVCLTVGLIQSWVLTLYGPEFNVTGLFF